MTPGRPEVSVRGPAAHPWRVACALLLIALVPALLSAWLHPHKPTRVHADDISVRIAQGWPAVLWVDARAASAYQRAHVPGAVNLSAETWEAQIGEFVEAWAPGRRVVVYCDGQGCNASREVAQRLRDELGLPDIHVLTGGWNAWQEERK